jgi:hypothetical protein
MGGDSILETRTVYASEYRKSFKVVYTSRVEKGKNEEDKQTRQKQ